MTLDRSVLLTVYILCIRHGELTPTGALSARGLDQMADMARVWSRHPDWASFNRAYTSPIAPAIMSTNRFLGELHALSGGPVLDASLPSLDLTFLDQKKQVALEALRGSVDDLLTDTTALELRGRMIVTLQNAAKECADEMIGNTRAVVGDIAADKHATASDLASVFGRGKRAVLIVGQSPLLELAAVEPLRTPRLRHGDAILYTVTMSAVEVSGLWQRRFLIKQSERLLCPSG